MRERDIERMDRKENAMLEFAIVISNELGEIIRYCDALTEDEIDRILEDHQEYTVLFVASEKDRF